MENASPMCRVGRGVDRVDKCPKALNLRWLRNDGEGMHPEKKLQVPKV